MTLNTIEQADCLQGLKGLPDRFINCCITSPPYFGLRDYGSPGQMGLEKTPEEYVQKLVELFREVRRVLRDDGTLWLNLGDSYASYASYRDGKAIPDTTRGSSQGTAVPKGSAINRMASTFTGTGIKHKDLIGIPWMVAFALRADGWYLRQDIIWSKSNPMPESVRDRCTKSHEYIFMLSKSSKYYYDGAAIRTPLAASTQKDKRLTDPDYETARPERGYPGQASKGSGLLVRKTDKQRGEGARRQDGFDEFKQWNNMTKDEQQQNGANKRSVWAVSTKPFKGAHFATFPPDLIEPCVLAGCPPGGLILDPFMGAGTTAMVAENNGRNYIGFELNAEYIKIAKTRLL